ncbi:MAG: Invasion associated locus B family protein [Hyphomicrobiales bacterium]
MIIARSLVLRLSAAVAIGLLAGVPRPLPAQAAPAKAKPATPAKPAKKEAGPAPSAAPAKGAPAKGGTGQALKLGQFDDWIAYATPGAKKICYALSVPKERLPKNLNRDPGYIFVSYRPDEKVRGEIAVVMGYSVKEDAPAQAVLGSTSFQLAGKDSSLFVHNAAEEGTMLAAMKKGGSLVVKASSKRGNATTDRFSLAGIAQAIDQAEKACK